MSKNFMTLPLSRKEINSESLKNILITPAFLIQKCHKKNVAIPHVYIKYHDFYVDKSILSAICNDPCIIIADLRIEFTSIRDDERPGVDIRQRVLASGNSTKSIYDIIDKEYKNFVSIPNSNEHYIQATSYIKNHIFGSYKNKQRFKKVFNIKDRFHYTMSSEDR